MLAHTLVVVHLIVQYSRCICRPRWHEYFFHDGHRPISLRGAASSAQPVTVMVINLARLMLVLGRPEVAAFGRRCRRQ